MNEEILKKLYEGAKLVGDVPDYDQFVLDMQDDDKLSRFRNSMAEYYDIPEVEQLKSDLGIVKKKEDTDLPSEDGSLDSQDSYGQYLLDQFTLGSTKLGEALSSPLETTYRIGSIPQNLLAYVLDKPELKRSPEKLSEFLGIKNKILEFYEQESERLSEKVELYSLKNYEKQGLVESFKAGNYKEGFLQLTADLVGSAPFSLSLMVGGAATTYPRLFMGSTPLLMGPEIKDQEEKGKGELETITNAFTISAAETAFGAIGSGTIGKVYRDILLREGVDQGKEVFRKGLIEVYEGALKKYGMAAGALGEGVEEVATQVTQNMANGLPAFQNVGDAFIQGFAGGGVYTSPITAMNARNYVQSTIAENKVNKIIDGTDYSDVIDVIRDVQNIDDATVEVAKTKNVDKLFNRKLESKVNSGEITKEEAEKLSDNFNKTKWAVGKTDLLENVSDDSKKKIASLLIEKSDLKRKIETIDDTFLSKSDTNKLNEINKKLETLESVGTIEAQAEPTAEPTAPPTVEPTVTETAPQTVAQALNRPATLTSLSGSVLETPIEGDLYVEGQQVVIEDEAGNITEIGNVDEISDSTLQEIGIEFAEPAVKPMTDGNLMFEDRVLLPDKKGIKRNKRGEISRVTLREQDGAFVTLRGANAEEAAYQILLREATSPEQAEFINQQLEQNDEFRKATETTQEKPAADTGQPAAGNRLLNEPLPDAAAISDRFAERKGLDRGPVAVTGRLDREKSSRISNLFDNLKPEPNNPKVKRAYSALAEETIEQYQELLDAGYAIEINNDEPYETSADMIGDLRDNKRMKIFSTESGFGSDQITDQLRTDNPLLRDSGFKDVNGQTLLVNDVFRAVHDFFGHAKLGNSFGPKGEEIAWRVHSKMFSPDARRAMTTETRGQNSWVNFSGVNDAAFVKRDEARALRVQAEAETDVATKKRLLEEAKKKVDEAYAEMRFADQKVALLPDELVFEEEQVSDVNKEADDFLASVDQKPLFQKEQAETDQAEIDLITEEMNELSDERAAFDVPSDLTTKNKINIGSLTERFDERVKTIGDISEYNGIPFMFAISDQLTTGVKESQFTGNTLEFDGGLGFNMTNDTSAWSNVEEDTAKQTLSTAQEVYSNNKELFDRLWAEGKLPNGHVPMAVVKMGQNSIESNEAVFRVVSDNLKSRFTAKERAQAQSALLQGLKDARDSIQSKLDRATDKDAVKKLQAQLNANKRVQEFASRYDSLEQTLDNITDLPITSRKDIRDLVFYGSLSEEGVTKPGSYGNKPVLNVLLDGKDSSFKGMFHMPTINEFLKEEATKDIPKEHIISIVGVDVLNPGITSVANGDFQHKNYSFGTKGQLIGVLESPVHAADVFPEMYSKSVYTFKENKSGALPSIKKAVTDSVAASGFVATIKAFRGARMSTKMSTLDIVLGKLRQAFPAVTVVSTQAEFDAAVNSPDVTKYSRDGDIIYGFTKGTEKVFLNPKIATTNTAIHEYGHVWMNFVEENNPALLQKGFDLLEGTDTLKEKIRIHGDNKTARMEALADLIGNKGESIVNAGQKSKFKNWLNAMYTYIKKKFKAFSDMSADEFQDMSLKQFVEGVLSDLVSGREVTDKVVRSVDTTFQKVNANDLIEKGIENGFSKQAIKLGLERMGADVSGFNDAYSAAKAKYDKNTGRPRQVEVDDIYDRSKKAIQDKVKKRNLKFYRDKTRELVLDRQARIKNLLNGIGSKEAQKAVNLLVTKAGASGYANFRFKEADQKIFKGLSVADTETLDKVIYARRIDAINDNRKQRGLESYVGIEGYNQETAKRNLKEIKDDIGAEKFNDLNKRATEYFKVFNQSLDRMREANLISEEVYIQLKETDYSPIKTIKYLIPDDYDVAQIDRMARITGMNRDLIKSLSDENVNDIIMDSRWLLMTNVSMVEARVSENRMLNAVYDAIDSATNEQVKGIEDYIKPNPVFNYTETRKPRYKYDVIKVPQGFVKVGFLRDGNRLDLVVQEAHARQLLDVKTDQKGLRIASKWSAVNILRFFATAANPVFIIPNSAIDFANILFLSEVYSKNKFSGGARLAFDAVSAFLSKVGGTKGYNKVYEEYMLHGGSMDYLASDGLRVLEDLTFKKSLNPAKKALLSIARALSYTGESSEIAFRLAVYNKSKENQIKDFKKTNKRDPDAQEMEDIMFGAAREARETIDFAQGGSVVKGADKVLPYFNAANQGFRKGLDYATENPLGFTTSVLQGMLMSASLTSLGIFLLLRAIGDDDEEEVKRVLNSVSDHEKANYHVIFTGRKNDEGEYEYYRIRKLPLTSAASTLAEQITISAMMEYKGIDYNINYNILLENVKSAAPIVPTAKNILSRNPALSALITYHFNYDMFYDQEVFKGPRDKKIKPSVEGIYDNRVEMIYKDLAKVLSPGLELSPKRAQAAVEKMITSETTNPTIGLIYSGYDGIRSIFSEGPGMNDELNTFIDRTVDNTSKKLIRYTNKNLIVYKQEADVEADRIESDTEKYLAEQKMYSEIRKRYKDDKGEFTSGEFFKLIEENFEPEEHSKYKKKYLGYIKNINADRAILDIIFEDSPEIQAKMLFNRYGDALEQEELEDLISASKAARRKLSKKGLYIYRQKYQKR